MANMKLIVNKTTIQVFDLFNELYSPNIVNLCPLLSKFCINVVLHSHSNYWYEAGGDDCDTFCFYINKPKAEITSTYAEIMVNQEMCDRLCFSDDEMLAALAHELGHIIMYFRQDKNLFLGQSLEVCCDKYACEIGFRDSLSSLLQKLIESGVYSTEQINQMRNRIKWIQFNYD